MNAEDRFKNTMRALVAKHVYPSPKTMNHFLNHTGGPRNSLNGRECQWREEVFRELGWRYVGTSADDGGPKTKSWRPPGFQTPSSYAVMRDKKAMDAREQRACPRCGGVAEKHGNRLWYCSCSSYPVIIEPEQAVTMKNFLAQAQSAAQQMDAYDDELKRRTNSADDPFRYVTHGDSVMAVPKTARDRALLHPRIVALIGKQRPDVESDVRSGRSNA